MTLPTDDPRDDPPSGDTPPDIHCAACRRPFPLARCLHAAKWCLWPDHWVRWVCPYCASENTTKFETGKITEGECTGLLAPMLVTRRIHSAKPLRVTFQKKGAVIRWKREIWAIPMRGEKEFIPDG